MNEQGPGKKDPSRRLAEINRAITTSLNFDEVLDLIVENAAQLVEARVCLLLLVDSEGVLRIRAARGVDPDLVQEFFRPDGRGRDRGNCEIALEIEPAETLGFRSGYCQAIAERAAGDRPRATAQRGRAVAVVRPCRSGRDRACVTRVSMKWNWPKPSRARDAFPDRIAAAGGNR